MFEFRTYIHRDEYMNVIAWSGRVWLGSDEVVYQMEEESSRYTMPSEEQRERLLKNEFARKLAEVLS